MYNFDTYNATRTEWVAAPVQDTTPLESLLWVVKKHQPILLDAACGILIPLIVGRLLIFIFPQRTSRLPESGISVMDRCSPAFRTEAIDLIDRALAYGLKNSNAAAACVALLAVVFRHRFAELGYFGPDEVAHQVIAQMLSQPLSDLMAGDDHNAVAARAVDALNVITPSILQTAWMEYQAQRADQTLITHEAGIHAGFIWPSDPDLEQTLAFESRSNRMDCDLGHTKS